MHRVPLPACWLAWKRVSPPICSDDDVKLQLVDRVCPGVDLGSPADPCKTCGTCHGTAMRGASQRRARQAALVVTRYSAGCSLISLTFCVLIFGGLDETLELDVDVDLDAQQQSHFEQHQLELTNT